MRGVARAGLVDRARVVLTLENQYCQFGKRVSSEGALTGE